MQPLTTGQIVCPCYVVHSSFGCILRGNACACNNNLIVAYMCCSLGLKIMKHLKNSKMGTFDCCAMLLFNLFRLGRLVEHIPVHSFTAPDRETKHKCQTKLSDHNLVHPFLSLVVTSVKYKIRFPFHFIANCDSLGNADKVFHVLCSLFSSLSCHLALTAFFVSFFYILLLTCCPCYPNLLE